MGPVKNMLMHHERRQWKQTRHGMLGFDVSYNTDIGTQRLSLGLTGQISSIEVHRVWTVEYILDTPLVVNYCIRLRGL